jgi:putative glycosyltransferase (TIGR04372 family)
MNKWMNRGIILFQYGYETRVAPFFATYVWFLWWPVYKALQRRNICFVVNIAEGTGQVLPELDNFFRMVRLKEIDPLKKYVWIRTRNDFSKALIPLYGHKFYYATMSNILYDLLLPIILRWQDITHDAGMAGLHWQLPKKGTWKYPKPWQTYLYIDTKEHVLTLWRQWYKRRSQSASFYPLREYAPTALIPDQELQHFLGGNMNKIALIHIKENIMNATAKYTDPSTYIPALEHLISEGYNLVFVGREKMPDAFKELPIHNYANSPVASFLHDLQLFTVASLSITGGSGIAWIADTIGTPILYLNSWHLFMPPWSPLCIFVPTLVQKKNGELLPFFGQFQLYTQTDFSKQGDVFPFEEYDPVNASSEEILHGLQELVSLITRPVPLTPQQESFRLLHTEGWTEYAASRISDYFLKVHRNLL